MKFNFTNQIQNFSAEVRGNFFMPGHKGKISPLDVTEFDETGDLTDSSGVFAAAEAELAKIFGAEKSHILVNGATVGIFAMIMATCQVGDKLIVDSICHHSIPNALKLFGVKPVYVERSIHLNSSLAGGINPVDIEHILKKDKKIKGAIITSPNYYGVCSDIRAIADILHSKDKFLLVDEAHGAHFYFSENLPQTAMEQGADMCVVSAHKTLPAPGQTAILNISQSACQNLRSEANQRLQPFRAETRGEKPLSLRASRPRRGEYALIEPPEYGVVKECLNILQTSSPSFMLISQMLDGISQMPELSGHYEKLIAACEEFAMKVNENTRATCVTWGYMNNCHVTQKDQTRLVISLARLGLNGKKTFDLLWERYKIRPEMYDDHNVVCIVSVCNEIEDLDNLYAAISELCEVK